MNRRVLVFILAGQSNMAGRGSVSELPEDLRNSDEHVFYDYVCSFGADNEEPFTSGGAYASEGWTSLGPCKKHPSTDEPHFGPEIAFARRVVELLPGEGVAIIKHGRGGTNLCDDWDPDATSGKMLFQACIDQARHRLLELQNDGLAPVIAGVHWFQGEGDTLRPESAKGYGQNLRRLIVRFRDELSATGFSPEEPPFIATQIESGAAVHPRTGRPWMVYSDTVRKAIRGVMGDTSRCGIVETDDLETLDHVHIDSDGLLSVGRRMADAWFTINQS